MKLAGILSDPRRLAWALALAGLLPFAALAIAIALLGSGHPLQQALLDAIRTYGAVILSFLGGIRWGFALRETPADPKGIGLSVLPSIVGWLALFLPPTASLGILLLAFCAQGAWDSLAIHGGKGPAWFAGIRIALTLLVALCLAIALIASV